MGTFLSQPFETDKIASAPQAASSASRAPLDAPGAPTSPEQPPALRNCWSCRVLSGSGLIGAGWYVYWVARKPLKLGYPPSPGTVTQMVIGISIACWGVIILSDPKGKFHP
ncbi:distal membrane-arm assembly complex protein 1 [Myotis yumanensis]|uniref:distal membrane-arm assembly complex protein 1 n=1 Tax=Myotis yumanensis TaxID=159337 RepID=UPI0003C438FB|nr:distal membrane-arm assembly complex protein 1 isoform X2 [Myotis lucifugus]